MLMNVSLPKFDIYQGPGARNCFKSHTNSFLFYTNITQRLTQVLHKKLQLS